MFIDFLIIVFFNIALHEFAFLHLSRDFLETR